MVLPQVIQRVFKIGNNLICNQILQRMVAKGQDDRDRKETIQVCGTFIYTDIQYTQ